MFIIERFEADLEVEKIKSIVKEASLDYFIEESPYSLRLNLKKKRLQDFSAVTSKLCSVISQTFQPYSQADEIKDTAAIKTELDNSNLAKQ